MSYFNILKSLSIVSLSALVGYSAVKLVMTSNSPNRYLASMTMSKMASEQLSKTLFDIKVKNVEVGLSDSDASTVQVSIEAFSNIPAGLTYTWNLPEDVVILEGAQQGSLAEFSANQVQEFTLKIKGYSKTKKSFISFQVVGSVGSTPLQREVLLSSRPEDSFEYIVQQKEKEKQLEARINKMGKAEYKSPIDPKKVIH